MKRYDIAAYIWPAYTGDEIRTRMFWQEGNGEWQSVKNVEKNSAEHKKGMVRELEASQADLGLS